VKEFQAGGRDLKDRMARIQQQASAAALRAETARSYRESKEWKLKVDRIRTRLSAAVKAYRTVVAVKNSVDPFDVIDPDTFVIDSEDDAGHLDQDEAERLDNNRRNRRLGREFKERTKRQKTAVDNTEKTVAADEHGRYEQP
jgi:hypothetical protein